MNDPIIDVDGLVKPSAAVSARSTA